MAVELVVIKRFTYRGDSTEEFSNSYKLTGADPADAAAWRTLFDLLVTEEKVCYPNNVSVIKGYGYDSYDEDREAVWSVDLRVSPNTPVVGTLNITNGHPNPGDSAVWVRWKLDKHNTRGRWVYLRKYFHPAYSADGQSDTVLTAQITALNAFGTKLQDGSFAGGRKVTDKDGTNVIAHGASAFVTTRTLKRRGKRPPTG